MGDPAAFVARLRDAWRRSDALFEMLAPEAFRERPIRLRQPFVFYVGHLPAFAWNQALRGVLLRGDSAEPGFDELFERGIDPPDDQDFHAQEEDWPALDRVLAYRDGVREALVSAVEELAARGRADVVERVIEHELMHHETLTYMLLRLPHGLKRGAAGGDIALGDGAAPLGSVSVPAGVAVLGAPREPGRFGWDNEFPERRVSVAPFRIDALPVRNWEFLEFVLDCGYREERLWSPDAWAWRTTRGQEWPGFWSRRDDEWTCRALFRDVPLAHVADWPVFVTWAEAQAYARWRGGRLPTEPEYHRAAFGAPDGNVRAHPWGMGAPAEPRGNFGFRRLSPSPVGTHPAGVSAWGVHDLVGDGWEWTSTPFAPFPGFEPMPGYEGYSADSFDGRHYVLLGASWATDDALVRRSFRNWFQPHYPHVFAKFRVADPAR
jgi:ergothioneine biosynthesis protein EgtB